MSAVRGKVGRFELSWLSVPRGASGSVRAKVDGKEIEVRWRRDPDGLWLELPHGTFGYDFEGEADDDGKIRYRVTERNGSGEWIEQAFTRAGEENTTAAAAGKKKGLRIRAQMPGKILRVLAKVGEQVSKGQPLLVMEAMKMENEIKAQEGGVVRECRVGEGQAVETGADLMILEP